MKERVTWELQIFWKEFSDKEKKKKKKKMKKKKKKFDSL